MIRLTVTALVFGLTMAGALAAQSASERYGAACMAAIGPVPSFDCDQGAMVPVTVDGVPVTDHAPALCDHPALLDNGPTSDGQCVPFSRILDLSTQEAQISVMCRQKHFRSADSTQYDEIDVIAHNPDTGATCWFQANSDDGGTVSGVAVPSPTAATDTSFWEAPEAVVKDGCGYCHDNDPFMYSPFVGQVWSHVPVNPFGPYAHVDAGFGFADWPTEMMDMRDNTCTGCHRIGSGGPAVPHEKPGSCGELAMWMTGLSIPPGADARAASFPGSHTMPPDFTGTQHGWDVIHSGSVDTLRSCCADPSQPICGLNDIRSYLGTNDAK